MESKAEPFCEFNGISDFSEVVTGTVNTVAAVVRNRLESFINGGDTYGLDKKLGDFVNKITGMIPDQIDLQDGLYLDGFLYSNIKASNQEVILPLKTQLRYDNATYNSSNC